MALITVADKNKLYLQVKSVLGWPLRPFELKDESLDVFFEMVVEDYSSFVNAWLIQQQWIGLEGLSRENSDFLSAFTTKPNTYMEKFTYAYSRQVGLGTNAPSFNNWELKRDFITTEPNVQHYLIPAGREINEVLWSTEPSIDSGLMDPFAMNAWAAGTMGWSFYGRPAALVQPVFSTLLAAQDRRMKQRVLQSTLSFRLTGRSDGSKILHLYPSPGDRHDINKTKAGTKIWYWYYDVNDSNRDKCAEENSDIIKNISDPPTKVLKWDNMNDVARQQIRDLLIARVKMTLGSVRGFFEGKINATDAQLVMDYRHLLDEGQKLKEDTEKIILDQLEKIRQVNLTEERMKISQNVNIERGFQPPMFPIVAI